MTLKWLSSYAPVDEEFDKVSLLLHGDGTNGSTTIVDSSSSPKAVTAVGDAQISTAQSKFGGASLAFDGTGDYLTVPSSADFAFGTGDFTVEFWLKSQNSSNQRGILQISDATGGLSTSYANGLVFYFPTGSGSIGAVVNGAGLQSANNILSLNTWYHVAATRSGTSFAMFVDGVQIITSTSSANLTASNLAVGGYYNTSYLLNGYIDDLRITKGVARYTSNFTPPTAPFPDLSPSGRVTIEDNSLDVDARQYIINVEEQDGQPLESGVRTAINDFVVGCKSDGIWNAIKASCILAGARTLDGALVPLTGGAPTNFSFVGADYDRETGLVGDGSTKYLDSNRNNNADPQNNKHVSCFIQDRGTEGGGARYISAGDSAGNDTFINNFDSSTIIHNVNSSGFQTTTYSGTGFAGLSRNSGSSYVARINSTNATFGEASAFPSSETYGLFKEATGAGPASNGRLAFYSIGESLDLAKLDTRVSNLITAIGAAIP